MNQSQNDAMSSEGTRQVLRYRLAMIAIFLIALFSAGLVDREWHGPRHPGNEVQSTR